MGCIKLIIFKARGVVFSAKGRGLLCQGSSVFWRGKFQVPGHRKLDLGWGDSSLLAFFFGFFGAKNAIQIGIIFFAVVLQKFVSMAPKKRRAKKAAPKRRRSRRKSAKKAAPKRRRRRSAKKGKKKTAKRRRSRRKKKAADDA